MGILQVEKLLFFLRFNNVFKEGPLSTIGIDKEIKIFIIGENIQKITLWDTPGQERYISLKSKLYQNKDGIFLLFDVTWENTFNNLEWLLNEIKVNIKNDQMPLIYLIGNKIDSDKRVISKDEAEEYAKSQAMKYFEISCKYDINNFEVLNLMILEVYKRKYLDSFKKLMTRYKIKIESDLMNNNLILNKYINY